MKVKLKAAPSSHKARAKSANPVRHGAHTERTEAFEIHPAFYGKKVQDCLHALFEQRQDFWKLLMEGSEELTYPKHCLRRMVVMRFPISLFRAVLAGNGREEFFKKRMPVEVAKLGRLIENSKKSARVKRTLLIHEAKTTDGRLIREAAKSTSDECPDEVIRAVLGAEPGGISRNARVARKESIETVRAVWRNLRGFITPELAQRIADCDDAALERLCEVTLMPGLIDTPCIHAVLRGAYLRNEDDIELNKDLPKDRAVFAKIHAEWEERLRKSKGDFDVIHPLPVSKA